MSLSELGDKIFYLSVFNHNTHRGRGRRGRLLKNMSFHSLKNIRECGLEKYQGARVHKFWKSGGLILEIIVNCDFSSFRLM